MSDNYRSALLPEGGSEQPSPQAELRIWSIPDGHDSREEPTPGASVRIGVTKEGIQAGINVPGESTSQMIDASTRAMGLVSSGVGPVILLKISVGLGMPWTAILALALTLAIVPIVHVLLGAPRHES